MGFIKQTHYGSAKQTHSGKVDRVISVAENDIAVAILRLIENEKVRLISGAA